MKTGPKPNPNANRKHPLYATWKGMRNRCNNPNGHDYALYGGRGIEICSDWEDFKTFARDMGPKPSRKHTIDRKDRDGDYSPENCKWATQSEQMAHTSRNRFLEADGKKMILAEWARILNVSHKLITDRIDRGWTVENALFEGKRPSGNRSFESHVIGWKKRRKSSI
jgi:hypothetical protein